MYHIKITIGNESITVDEVKRALARAAVEIGLNHPEQLAVYVTRTIEPKQKAVSFAGLTPAPKPEPKPDTKPAVKK